MEFSYPELIFVRIFIFYFVYFARADGGSKEKRSCGRSDGRRRRRRRMLLPPLPPAQPSPPGRWTVRDEVSGSSEDVFIFVFCCAPNDVKLTTNRVFSIIIFPLVRILIISRVRPSTVARLSLIAPCSRINMSIRPK